MDTLVWIGFIMLAIVTYLWYSSHKNRIANNYPPCPRPLPILGHIIPLLKTSYITVTRMGKQFGGIFMLEIFGNYFLFINHWDDMKEALINQADVFSSKVSTKDKRISNLNQRTFLFIDGPVWKEKRRFTLHHLRNFGFGKTSMENTICEEFNRVTAVIDQHQTMKFNGFFFCPFLNVLWGIVAGKTYEYGNEELKRVSNAIKSTFDLGKKGAIISIFPLMRHVPFDPFCYGQLTLSVTTVITFIEKQIDEHLATIQDNELRDYMDAYLHEIKNREGTQLTEETSCYTRDHLTGGIYDILQAGVETTATTLEWSLLYMATWPEIQKKVQHELDTVIGRSRRPIYSDSTMLPYVKATLLEVQRYCSVIPICSPRITTRTTTLKNYTIPKGTVVFQNLYSVHHDKKIWNDPQVFRPERFLDETGGKAEKPDGWVPFSLGPRICLGETLARMELFLYFTGLLHKYEFQLVTGQSPPSLVPVNSLTLQPQPFELVIKHR